MFGHTEADPVEMTSYSGKGLCNNKGYLCTHTNVVKLTAGNWGD